MSIFGEPLPHEDDTATSLIRRTGFPPTGTYDQMPQAYMCPCCSEFSKQQERDRLLAAAAAEKEAARRRLLQLDVFDERARPLPSGPGRKPSRRYQDDDDMSLPQSNLPPPPPTLDELRQGGDSASQNRKLVVTVHHGKNLVAEPRDPLSVIVRCGAFEGQTAKVARGKGTLTTWDELFEFPYPNTDEPLEVLVINDGQPEDHLLGGVVVPPQPLNDRTLGDEESLPVMPEDQMQNGYGQMKEGPLGAVVVSWYVSEGGEDGMDETALEQQNLNQPLGCTFVAHRIFQYTDSGAEAYPGGVLCVLRDTEDNCSESVLYTPGSMREPSVSPYYSKEGYHYLPENPAQIMQLNTEKKLGHILICVPKDDDEAPADQEEELLVVGAVPLDFERLYHRGAAVLLIESKSKDDAMWGEISIEWANHPLVDEAEIKPPQIEVDKESLYITVVRGLDLHNRENQPIPEAYVSVSTGDMEGVTIMAPCVEEDGHHIITWNQEIRFIEVEPDEKNLEVFAYENGLPVCKGNVELNEDDEGVCIVQMHDLYNDKVDRGEIVLSYKRLHVTAQPPMITDGDDKGADEEDEEDEEVEEAEVDEEDEEDGDAERQRREREAAEEAERQRREREAAEEEERQRREREAAEEAERMDEQDEEQPEPEEEPPAAEEEEEPEEDQEDEEDGAHGDDEGHEEEDNDQAHDGAEDGDDQEHDSEGDAKDGEDGQDGQDGQDGEDGQDGQDGQDSHDGQDGEDGADGADAGAEDADQHEEYPQEVDDNANAEDEDAGAGEGEEAAEGEPKEHEGAQEEEEYVPAPPPEANTGGSPNSATSGSRSPKGSRRGSTPRKSRGFQQPWYPSGSPKSQAHIPYEKTSLAHKNKEGIRELEKQRNKLVEDSVRRGSVSRSAPRRTAPAQPAEEDEM